MTLPALAPALLLIGTPAQAGVAATPAPLIDTRTTPPPLVLATPPAAAGAAPAPAGDTLPPGAVPHHHAPGDPLEGFNRRMFRLFQGLDRGVFRPAAMGYKHVVPKPVRGGLRHFFSNLGEPVVFLNYLLQFKPGKAIETLGRFVINSTLGVGGLIDVAKTRGFRLPHRDNGFGNTLAVYGVKPGPYIFLPFLGPSTLRDLFGGQADGLVLPLAVGKPFDRLYYQVPRAVITGLDQRAESDADLKALYAGAVDPYATLRAVYLQDRQGEIDRLRGHPGASPALDNPAAGGAATPELSDPLADPAAKPSVATPSAATPSELSDPLADPAQVPATSKAPVTTPTTGPDTSDPLTDPAAPSRP